VAAATTFALKQCAEEIYGFRALSKLPQVFQALRIAVNHEIDALTILLETGPRLLKSGGRMGVITYHSLEDRPVKQIFRSLCMHEKDEWTGAVSKEADFVPLTKKPILPGNEEREQNPRSRSAKLRAIRRTQFPH
jgi:16S rRNA (cytosine1402-N4)-methyltransferase